MKVTDAFGKSSTSKISYVNSEATDSQLVAFAQKINQLTTNQLDGASRVTTTELSTAEKLPRTLTFTPATATLSEIRQATQSDSAYEPIFEIKSNGTDISEDPLAMPEMQIKSYTCYLPACIRKDVLDDPDPAAIEFPRLMICAGSNYDYHGSTTGTITVALPENDKYAYAEATFTVTE